MKIRTLLARAKRKLFRKPFIKDRRYPAFWFDQFLGEREAYLVQIGSNDGKTGDPFYPLLQKNKDWKALFVEPIPHFFNKLLKNYPDRARFRFENVAINEGVPMTFYWVDAKAKQEFLDLPFWYEQLGSFDRKHILNHLDGKLEPYIISQEVEGISLPTLLERNNISKIDFLHIDAEGYDWKILSQLDLHQYTPTFILYEYHHLQQEELKAADNFLREQYAHFYLGIDAVAIHKELAPEIIQKMSANLLQRDPFKS